MSPEKTCAIHPQSSSTSFPSTNLSPCFPSCRRKSLPDRTTWIVFSITGRCCSPPGTSTLHCPALLCPGLRPRPCRLVVLFAFCCFYYTDNLRAAQGSTTALPSPLRTMPIAVWLLPHTCTRLHLFHHRRSACRAVPGREQATDVARQTLHGARCGVCMRLGYIDMSPSRAGKQAAAQLSWDRNV